MAVNPLSDPASNEAAWGRLVTEIAAGNERAMAEFYDRSNRIVYGLALRMLRDPASAEDVTLEVYMQVWRTASGYSRERGTVISWLITLTRSRAIDLLRARRARTESTESPLDEVFALPHPGPSPEDASLESRTANAVRKALADLPGEQREAIELAFFAGLTQSEIAERQQLPLGTVKTRIRQGMLRLRQWLEPLSGVR